MTLSLHFLHTCKPYLLHNSTRFAFFIFRLLNCSSKMDIYLSCFQLLSGCRITVHRTFSIGYHFSLNSDNAMCSMKANDLSFSAKTVVPYFSEGWGGGGLLFLKNLRFLYIAYAEKIILSACIILPLLLFSSLKRDVLGEIWSGMV